MEPKSHFDAETVKKVFKLLKEDFGLKGFSGFGVTDDGHKLTVLVGDLTQAIIETHQQRRPRSLAVFQEGHQLAFSAAECVDCCYHHSMGGGEPDHACHS